MAAARELRDQLERKAPVLCMATAHPGKFPGVTARALGGKELPPEACHPALQAAADLPRRGAVHSLDELKPRLIAGMKALKT